MSDLLHGQGQSERSACPACKGTGIIAMSFREHDPRRSARCPCCAGTGKVVTLRSDSGMTDDEARVDALILDVLNGIQGLNGRRLRVNGAELAQAIHVLQGFVRQSACHGLGLFDASDWWEDADA